jgi:hypothetical protein
VVFFGGYATSLYSKYMDKDEKQISQKISNFDVVAEDIDKCANKVKQALSDEKYKNIKLLRHKNIQDIIPECIEIKVGNRTMAFVYKPIACHSYNKITINRAEINIATIDTILAFYLAFLYVNGGLSVITPTINLSFILAGSCDSNVLFCDEEKPKSLIIK